MKTADNYHTDKCISYSLYHNVYRPHVYSCSVRMKELFQQSVLQQRDTLNAPSSHHTLFWNACVTWLFERQRRAENDFHAFLNAVCRYLDSSGASLLLSSEPSLMFRPLLTFTHILATSVVSWWPGLSSGLINGSRGSKSTQLKHNYSYSLKCFNALFHRC